VIMHIDCVESYHCIACNRSQLGCKRLAQLKGDGYVESHCVQALILYSMHNTRVVATATTALMLHWIGLASGNEASTDEGELGLSPLCIVQ
jgi:hypothetical protein